MKQIHAKPLTNSATPLTNMCSLRYLKASSEFQPTLYARFNEHAAVMLIKEDCNTLMRSLNECANAVGEEVEEAAKKTEDRMREILTESRELLSQDGKTRETFFFDLRREVNGQIGEMENLLAKVKKWILITLLTNVGLTTAVSLIIGYLMG